MRHVFFLAAIRTPQAKKTKVKIATASEALKEISDSRVEGPVLISKTLVIDVEKHLVMVFHDQLQIVGRSTRPIPRARVRSG